MASIKVTVTAEDGRVLDTLLVDAKYLQGVAVYPEDACAQALREVLEENFDVTVVT